MKTIPALPVAAFMVSLVLIGSCADKEGRRTAVLPTSASAVSEPELPGAVPNSTWALRPFPGREQAYQFRRVDLEQAYRNMGRGRFTTYVDPEGSVIWVGEYLRYRAAQCSHDEALTRIRAQINQQGVPAVCGQTEQPFPSRSEALTFRRQLETTYQSRGAGLADTVVDDEGDVIWTMEYYRYVLSGCSHAATIQKIQDQIAQRGVPADCSTIIPPVVDPVAGFSVTPNNTNIAASGQCYTESAVPNNILRCAFDGRLSTPANDIISYQWNFFGVSTFSGSFLQNVTVPCGSFGSASGATQRTVTLTVRTSAGRSDDEAKTVTFIKPSFC